MLPTARTEKLTVQELADEILVFDHLNGKAHCLNKVAGLVWKHCDGRTSTAALARRLGIAEVSVTLALEQLHRRKLLDDSFEPLTDEARQSRRDALKKLAAAAVLLPAIMTISAPAAMAAASKAQTSCTSNGDCSSLNQDCVVGRCQSGKCVAVTQADSTPCSNSGVCCSGRCGVAAQIGQSCEINCCAPGLTCQGGGGPGSTCVTSVP